MRKFFKRLFCSHIWKESLEFNKFPLSTIHRCCLCDKKYVQDHLNGDLPPIDLQ